MTFDMIKSVGEWMPIRDCPGRYVLRGAPPTLGIAGLVGGPSGIVQFRSPRARDEVWVACLEDGGLISYRRPDRTWLHTLNTREGFRRKLAQLGIDLSGSAA